MTKEEKDEILIKDINEITDDEIDDYIKKNVKIKRVNKAKIAAITAVPFIIGTIASSCIFWNAGLKDDYQKVSYHNVYYQDEDKKEIIEKDVKESSLSKDYLVVISKWQKEKDNLYVRDVSKIEFYDKDLSKEATKLLSKDSSDLINEKEGSIHVVKEYNSNPNLDEEEKKYAIYNELSDVKDEKKSPAQKRFELFVAGVGSVLLGGGMALCANFVETQFAPDLYLDKKVAKSNIKQLKDRKRKKNKH
ncbi:MAG: hypothetical protein IJ094_01380 [Bacilli bacterium]|nr:hypothetical protein [Bacilli bacterium]